jgi:hypothetical protein
MSQSVAHADALSDLETSLVESISIDEPWALVERFSTLERVSGTEDERAAAEYITGRLDALGVDHERHDPELFISQPHGAEITTLNRTLEFGPVKTVAFSAERTVSGEAVFVGGPEGDVLDAGAGAEEAYADVGDLGGKIALTTGGGLSIEAMETLEGKGAVGVISIHEHRREPHSGIATPVWGGAPPLAERERIPDLPIANVNSPDGEVLKEWAESDEGLELELSTDVTTGWMECPVVVAEIEADADTDEFVLAHGHYDSWYVGIADNATGDAGLLELARAFEAHAEDLQRNLRVAWWPGHSTGRYAGSTWYADRNAVDIAENCVAQVNMDSPGAKGSTEYTDMACWCPEAHDLVGGAITDVTGADYAEHYPFRAGDYSFDNLGVTGFFMLSSNIPQAVREERGYHGVGGSGGNSDAWHVSTDTIDKAGKDELVRDIRVYAVSLARVLAADVLPFDHRRTVAKLRDAAEEDDEAAGDAFDLSPTLSALDELDEALADFHAAVDAGDVPPGEANDAITGLSRTLTRRYLTTRGRFEQDPATGRSPFPKLWPATRFDDVSGDDERFLAVQLRRAQNDAVYALREARRSLPTQ